MQLYIELCIYNLLFLQNFLLRKVVSLSLFIIIRRSFNEEKYIKYEMSSLFELMILPMTTFVGFEKKRLRRNLPCFIEKLRIRHVLGHSIVQVLI